MFERFVLPDLVRCCEYLDYGFYHLDGPGELPHLPLLLKIERLRGIQWITGDGNPPPNRWLEVLKKIVDAGKLVQVFVKADQALEILNQFPNEFFSLHLCGGEPKDVERVLEKAS